MKETIKMIGVPVVYFLTILLIAYGIGLFASKAMSDYEVIEPNQGVKCVVVSRMFNTSVDCWKE